jgi:hypothetical protein
MKNKTILKGAASLAALVAVGAAGFAISSGSNNSASASGAAATSTSATTVPGGSPPTAGQRPPGGPMIETPVTGTAAEKARAAALAEYPGTVERVLKSPTSGYIVHVIQKDGSEVHVLVSATFKVTGTGTGGPPRGASPNGVPPAVTPPGSTSSS